MMKVKNYTILIGLILLSWGTSVIAQQWTLAGSVNNPGPSPSICVGPAPGVVWIGGGNLDTARVFRTTNSGVLWTSVPVTGINEEVNCIWAVSETNAFAGEGTVSGNARLLLTSNAGLTWSTILQTPPNGGHFTGLAFTKGNGSVFGLAIAERIYRSSNNGANWVEVNAGANGVSNAQNSLFIIDNLFYGFGLDNGAARLRLTTDNSVSWATQNVNVTGNYTSAVAFHTNKLFGVAATSTSMPMIGRTTDGGTTWNAVNIGPGLTGSCYIQWIAGISVVYIMGGNGGIKRSLDNGMTWTSMTTAGVTGLTHFDFMRYYNIIYGYAVSSNGQVIKLADSLAITGISPVNSIAENYSLRQNYPNPFNPSTNIEFSIPNNGFVNLKIYNSLGEEISELVNGELRPGTYEVKWDASGQSSGIYFYTLNAGSYRETRKMILTR